MLGSECMAVSGALVSITIFLQNSSILGIHIFHRKIFDNFVWVTRGIHFTNSDFVIIVFTGL